jgi:hypothetical protein
MNKDFAWEFLLNSIKAGAIINRIVPDLKKNYSESEYLEFKKSIGVVSCFISDEFVSKLLQMYPEFKIQIEKEFQKNNNI